jgi:hypothetical protein
MSPLEAFDDERLNADLAAILNLRAGGDTPSINHRLPRRQTALKDALRSPHAFATIGASFFIAMLGVTAFFVYHPSGGQSDKTAPRPSGPRPNASQEAPNSPHIAARIDGDKSPIALAAGPSDGADHARRHVRPPSGSRRNVNPPQDDATIDVAVTGGGLSTPVVVESHEKPREKRDADLAMSTSPLPLPYVEASADDRGIALSAADDAGAEDRLARIRRNSVAAIRALRRQW